MYYRHLVVFFIFYHTSLSLPYDDLHNHRKFGKDNKLNKAVWIKNSVKHSFFEKPYQKDFIFRPNSVEGNLQENVNYIGEVSENKPYSSYFDRSKRSLDEKSVQLIFPVEENTKRIDENDNKPTTNTTDVDNLVTDVEHTTDATSFNVNDNENKAPRSVIVEDRLNNVNETDYSSKGKVRNVFDREKSFWPKISTKNKDSKSPDVQRLINVKNYEKTISSKTEIEKDRIPTNEKGLNKLITALTRALKKVMAQFASIKKVESNLRQKESINNEKLAILNAKLNDVTKQQKEITNSNDKIHHMETKIHIHEDFIEKRHKEIMGKMKEFRNNEQEFFKHQKSFLEAQQMILLQNKKLTSKLIGVAKAQNEILRKQNYLAQVLKSLKENQDYHSTVNEYMKPYEPVTPKFVQKPKNKEVEMTSVTQKTYHAQIPKTTERIKINLFKIPVQKKLNNQDRELLRDKEIKSVDDLIYKYYFNNTFIDNLFKEQLEGVISNSQDKSKRTDDKTTILYPVQNTNENISLDTIAAPLIRKRRWINHRSKRRRNHRFGTVSPTTKKVEEAEEKPFIEMAKNFCVKIGRNGSEQALKWCVEKALRKLNYLEVNTPITPLSNQTQNKTYPEISIKPVTNILETTVSTGSTTKNIKPAKLPEFNANLQEIKPVHKIKEIHKIKENYEFAKQEELANDIAYSAFFPGNDELESNLQQFDLTPDTDGNVYFDGSIHTSGDTNVSLDDTISDAKPDLDSNQEVDPMVLNMKNQRKAMVNYMKDNIMKKLSRG